MIKQFENDSKWGKTLLYPVDWSEIAYIVKSYNNWRCQSCDKLCRRPGEMNLGWEYELSAAHYDGEYDTPEVFIVALCTPCHFRHDSPYVWVSRRRHARIRQRFAGQLEIFPSK